MDALTAIEPTQSGHGVSCHRIDPGIAREVRILWEHGVNTIESCEGGAGHAFSEPIVRFKGNEAEGLRAFGIAVRFGLKVREVLPAFDSDKGRRHRTAWEMTFERD